MTQFAVTGNHKIFNPVAMQSLKYVQLLLSDILLLLCLGHWPGILVAMYYQGIEPHMRGKFNDVDNKNGLCVKIVVERG